VCIDLHQTGFVGESSDHLQLIKFWPFHAPGKGVCGGAEKPYYSQRAVCVSLSAFLIRSYNSLHIDVKLQVSLPKPINTPDLFIFGLDRAINIKSSITLVFKSKLKI